MPSTADETHSSEHRLSPQRGARRRRQLHAYKLTTTYAWDYTTTIENKPTNASAMTCASCGIGSRLVRSGWQICRCGLAYCGSCNLSGCEFCGMTSLPTNIIPIEQQPAEETHMELDDAYTDETALPMPTILTPEGALQRRERIITEHAEALIKARVVARERTKQQIREGRRPRRTRPPDDTTSFASANVTTSLRLKDELVRGGELSKCDFIAVQETGLYGELVGHATDWLRRCRWAGVLDAAYRKHQGHGGGTAVLTRHPAGVRRAAQTNGMLKGRLTPTVTQLGKAINFTSFYGISGAPLATQLPLWKELADGLLRVGKPFVVAGDWQRPPQDLKTSGLCTLS